MTGHLSIMYSFRFQDGTTKMFPVLLDRVTLQFVPRQGTDGQSWARLDRHQCPHCPLLIADHPFCPIARNIADIAEVFKDRSSMETAYVTVAVEERSYVKDTTIQHGLSPLLGIVMATSGCPIMEPLKPMVRFHLPFASLEETAFRMVSMYLVGQFLRSREGKDAECGLTGLARIYEGVEKVNKAFAARMHAAAQSDANVNALVNLDVFATMVPRIADDLLLRIKPFFAAHLA